MKTAQLLFSFPLPTRCFPLPLGLVVCVCPRGCVFRYVSVTLVCEAVLTVCVLLGKSGCGVVDTIRMYPLRRCSVYRTEEGDLSLGGKACCGAESVLPLSVCPHLYIVTYPRYPQGCISFESSGSMFSFLPDF